MTRYDAAWRRYRHLRTASLLGALCFVLLIAFPRIEAPLRATLFIAVAALLIGAWFPLNFSRCPRCEKFFAMKWWFNLSLFAPKCVHCGLRKFGDDKD
jgi:hypothetical protein